MDTTNVEKGATIELDGCDTDGTVVPGHISIAQAFADRFKATVDAYKGGVSFGFPFPPVGCPLFRIDNDYPRTLFWWLGMDSAEPTVAYPRQK